MEARKAWLALKTPLTLVLLLAFVALVGAWGYKQATTPIPKRPPDPCVVQAIGPKFTGKNAYIRIFNGTTTSKLANNTKLVFGNYGYHVVKVASAESPVAKTYVAGASVHNPEMLLVLSFFAPGTPSVEDPVKYADHTVDIYLGSDFKVANLSPTPVLEVALPDGKACVPVYKDVTDG